MRERYSGRYYFQRVTQSKSGSFYLILRKKTGRLTQIEKINLIENVDEINQNIYNFYSLHHDFIFQGYFPFVKLVKQQ